MEQKKLMQVSIRSIVEYCEYFDMLTYGQRLMNHYQCGITYQDSDHNEYNNDRPDSMTVAFE